MNRIDWRDAHISPNADGEAWELYHENSKTSRYDAPLSNEEVRLRMLELWPSLTYDGYPTIALPSPEPLSAALSEVILGRHTARNLQPGQVTLSQLSSLLHYSYGQTRDMTQEGYPRPFRVVPSGGALFPLELYIHSSRVLGLDAGWYHYSSADNTLHCLQAGDDSRRLSDALVQQNLALDASVVIVISALFARSTFKYRERGYRFALIEAGHVGQNLCLVAQALGMGVIPIGGFLDRDVDALLSFDGLM
ncbi:MAG: SagB/ThcOx family dehydrogenase, partial [Undibacterium sp.]|nr:SagB/ThcOx family dehydrogenase [Undibacterium sp.]